jgi:hypothetical protein
MKRITIIAAAAMLLGASFQAGYAQNLNKHIDDAENVAIDYLASNGYIITGKTTPPTVGGMSNMGAFGGNLERIQLQKLDANLNTIWTKTYAADDEVATVQNHICSNLSNYFTVGDVKQTKDEGFIICGRVRRDPETSGCGHLGNYDHLFMLKTDKDGKVQWFKRYDRYGMLNSVVETPSGDFIACGRLGSPSSSTGLIIYTNPAGNLLWSKEAITYAYWDHSQPSNGSEYYEVINFKDNFAVVGINNYWGTIWAGTLITMVDAAGNVLQNANIDNQNYGYVISARGVEDARDGELVITGMAGTPCKTGAQVFILKIEPYSMAVNFLRIYSYNNAGDASMGASISVDDAQKKIFVTGIDWGTNGGSGIYLETDYSGNLNRYTPFNATEALWGKGIIYNPAQGIPVFSGYFSPNTQSTFVVRNDQDRDCSPDMYVPDYSTHYEVYDAKDKDPGLKDISDKAHDYKWDYKERIVCGSVDAAAKNGTSSVKNVVQAELALAPNPANTYIDISIGNASFTGGMLYVHDVTGRIVFSADVKAGNAIHLNTSALQPGMYILQVQQSGGHTYRANFTKE